MSQSSKGSYTSEVYCSSDNETAPMDSRSEFGAAALRLRAEKSKLQQGWSEVGRQSLKAARVSYQACASMGCSMQ